MVCPSGSRSRSMPTVAVIARPASGRTEDADRFDCLGPRRVGWFSPPQRCGGCPRCREACPAGAGGGPHLAGTALPASPQSVASCPPDARQPGLPCAPRPAHQGDGGSAASSAQHPAPADEEAGHEHRSQYEPDHQHAGTSSQDLVVGACAPSRITKLRIAAGVFTDDGPRVPGSWLGGSRVVRRRSRCDPTLRGSADRQLPGGAAAASAG